MLRLPPSPDFPGLVRRIEQRGMTRRAIAKTLHVSPSTVCRWVTGDRRPSYSNGRALVVLADSAPNESGRMI